MIPTQVETLAHRADSLTFSAGTSGTGGAMATGARNSMLRQQIVATQIAAGDDFTAILSECGNIYTWGKNNHGQLGQGHFRNQTSPVAVSGVRTRVRQISCGSHFMAAVSEHGALYNWGGEWARWLLE